MATPLTKGDSSASKFSVDGEDDMQIEDNSVASNKLDVMSSKQFNRITFLNLAVVFYSFVHVIFISTACRTVWAQSVQTKGIHGDPLTISKCNAPPT